MRRLILVLNGYIPKNIFVTLYHAYIQVSPTNVECVYAYACAPVCMCERVRVRVCVRVCVCMRAFVFVCICVGA